MQGVNHLVSSRHILISPFFVALSLTVLARHTQYSPLPSFRSALPRRLRTYHLLVHACLHASGKTGYLRSHCPCPVRTPESGGDPEEAISEAIEQFPVEIRASHFSPHSVHLVYAIVRAILLAREPVHAPAFRDQGRSIPLEVSDRSSQGYDNKCLEDISRGDIRDARLNGNENRS